MMMMIMMMNDHSTLPSFRRSDQAWVFIPLVSRGCVLEGLEVVVILRGAEVTFPPFFSWPKQPLSGRGVSFPYHFSFD